jgi:hypothetical protein
MEAALFPAIRFMTKTRVMITKNVVTNFVDQEPVNKMQIVMDLPVTLKPDLAQDLEKALSKYEFILTELKELYMRGRLFKRTLVTDHIQHTFGTPQGLTILF